MFNVDALPTTSSGVPQTTSPNVKVELTSTLGPPASVSGPISGPNSTGTVAYRTGFDPTQLGIATYTPYTVEPTVYNVGFQNTIGTQFYWVDFKDNTGKIDRRSAQIEIVAPGTSGPIFPTPTPTPTPTPIVCTPCSADIDKSGGVDIVDYSYLVSCYNKKATDVNKNGKSCAPADINGDGVVSGSDFTCLTSKFGQRCGVSTPTPAPQADLTVSSVQVLGTSRVKGRNSINITLRNSGTANVGGTVTVALRITQPSRTILGDCATSFSSLSAGGTITVQVRNCPIFKTSGTHTITATVDSTNVVAETNEKNNQLSTTVNVNK